MKQGQTVKVIGYKDDGELARVDFIEFRPASGGGTGSGDNNNNANDDNNNNNNNNNPPEDDNNDNSNNDNDGGSNTSDDTASDNGGGNSDDTSSDDTSDDTSQDTSNDDNNDVPPGDYDAMGATAVSTFESIGISWSPPGRSANREVFVEYRKQGDLFFKEALSLWYDNRNGGEYRGSVMNLDPDSTYEIRLTMEGSSASAFFAADTWSEDFPIAQTVYLPEDSSVPLKINQSGNANGYILYRPAPGSSARINVARNYNYAVEIRAHHVIVQGLDIRGGRSGGVGIFTGAHDVVIEDNEISRFGDATSEGWAKHAAGIYVPWNQSGIRRLIIQRNEIHRPFADTNSWTEARSDINQSSTGWHPQGANAIFTVDTEGNHVIRYNHIHSTEDRYFNDGIGGSNNDGYVGAPHRDSDIYGNIISQTWDDAIEAEGANENVRIWNNYMNEVFMGIGGRDTNVGPLYIFRNVTARSRFSHSGSHDNDRRGHLLKAGSDVAGRVYIFHNTLYQPVEPGQSHGGGVAEAIQGSAHDSISRNNIFHVAFDNNHVLKTYDQSGNKRNDFDYDLYTGWTQSHPGAESNGINAEPVYDSGNGDMEFYLHSSSPGFNDGIIIPNINDDFSGAAPDMGAFERGNQPIIFGLEGGNN
ncbi:MAG: fibronectin type III domain-containing protein [Pseudomonadota bacterium]